MVVLMSDDNETESEQRSKAERAEAVEKAVSGDAPRTTPPKNDPAPPEDAPGVGSAGESITRGGEQVAREESKEEGRHDTGTEGGADRPTGTSTARDATGVDPQDPD